LSLIPFASKSVFSPILEVVYVIFAVLFSFAVKFVPGLPRVVITNLPVLQAQTTAFR